LAADEEFLKTLRDSLKTVCECIDALACQVLDQDKRIRVLEEKEA